MRRIDENREVIMPIDNVTANPLTAPLPKKYKKNATIKVVMLESAIVLKALVKPYSKILIMLVF